MPALGEHIRAFIVAMAMPGLLLAAPKPVPASAELARLTSAAQIHVLTSDEAGRGHPVHLQVTALIYLPKWTALFTSDSSGGIYLEMRGQPILPIESGSLLEVEGITGAGDYAPIVVPRSVKVIGKAELPPARRVSLDRLSSGVEDGQWVEVEGTVHSAGVEWDVPKLVLAAGSFRVDVRMPEYSQAGFERLIDAKVRVRGAAGPIFNKRRQIIGVNMYTPSLSEFQVLEKPPADPFAIPLQPLGNVLAYRPGGNFDHRVRIRGTVTGQSSAHTVFLSEGKDAVLVQTSRDEQLRPGDVVDAVGFPRIGEVLASLQESLIRRVMSGPPPVPRAITYEQALSGDYENSLVRIQARLVSQEQRADQISLLLNTNGVLFQALLAKDQSAAVVADLRDGSNIQLTGNCVIPETVAVRHRRVPKVFQILLRSPDDIVTLETSSWWTVRHALYVAGAAGLAIILALTWVLALRRRVAEQTSLIKKQLREAELLQETAESASRAKSEFLANMSHEIRTPLNAVLGLTNLLLDMPLSEESREYVETIRVSSDSLLSILNDILDFSKIESGKLEFESAPFELAQCLEDAVDLLSSRAAEKEVNLALDLDCDAPIWIEGDSNRLRQILVNLIGNAVKFTQQGEVIVGVKRDPGGAGILFSVRDTGPGIPPERLDRLFRSFSQVDASTTRHYGGTGLGLAISKRLTELMGGRIWVESQPGVGSNFQFTIPEHALQQEVPRQETIPGCLDGRRILIAITHETTRRVLETQCSDWGMHVASATCCQMALRALEANAFDIVLADARLVLPDGLTLGQEIRRRGISPRALLVLLGSAAKSMAGLQKGIPEGVYSAYLTTPVRRRLLRDLLARLLSGQRSPSPVRNESVIDHGMAQRLPLRILVAEDNLVNQKVAVRLLERMGYRPDVAANGLETLTALEQKPYDLILLDVQMPEMDGPEAARRIVAEYGQDRPRIVALTASAFQDDRQMCFDAGMDDYLSKPLKLLELQRALEEAGKVAPPVVSG